MKRRNPFQDYSSFHQKKVYIGQKELDLGVNSSHRMASIYEKTVNTLLNNVKKNWKDVLRKQHVNENGLKLPVSTSKRDRQMTLDTDINGKLLGHVLPNGNGHSAVNISSCSYCNNIAQLSSIRCSFCEKLICTNCCQQCSRCCELFCTLCSIKSYQEKEDTALCFSCA